MGENLAEAGARVCHAACAHLAHAHAVARAVAFQQPARAVRCGRKVAPRDRAPAPLPRLGNSSPLVARFGRLPA